MTGTILTLSDGEHLCSTESLPALRHGTAVSLPDGSYALAYRDVYVGSAWGGTYRTVQASIFADRPRVDLGWRREQLTEVPSVHYDRAQAGRAL